MIQAKKHVVYTLEDLKNTLKQLIHTEQMTSLGKLTTGITTKVQKQLTFVNDFSEVDVDLLEDLKERLNLKKYGTEKCITQDSQLNPEKTNRDGKRDYGVENTMVLYSGSNFKPLTSPIEKVLLDIGPLILNISTNAFHTISDCCKKKSDKYSPVINDRTSLKDSGYGIINQLYEKIVQPYYGTKSTGQGTGLGLNLVFDTVKVYDRDNCLEIKTVKKPLFTKNYLKITKVNKHEIYQISHSRR